MIATMIIIVFHCWAIMGASYICTDNIMLVFSLLGEIGVICFFVLSGYGIYFLPDCNSIENQKLDILSFYKKRMIRILPAYYGLILVLVLIGNGSYYLSKKVL